MLAGLREQLEATRGEAFIAMRQRILANNRAAMVEAERDRTQNMVVDLQHEVHFLNNQLHLILNEEEEDPEMLIENDGWEEEVELEDEDDAIFDLDSEHAEDQSCLVTS